MNGTVMQAVLFIFAGLFLSLLIIRRSKRKAQKNS
jgi:preprotein translocase subunit YajC